MVVRDDVVTQRDEVLVHRNVDVGMKSGGLSDGITDRVRHRRRIPGNRRVGDRRCLSVLGEVNGSCVHAHANAARKAGGERRAVVGHRTVAHRQGAASKEECARVGEPTVGSRRARPVAADRAVADRQRADRAEDPGTLGVAGNVGEPGGGADAVVTDGGIRERQCAPVVDPAARRGAFRDNHRRGALTALPLHVLIASLIRFRVSGKLRSRLPVALATAFAMEAAAGPCPVSPLPRKG